MEDTKKRPFCGIKKIECISDIDGWENQGEIQFPNITFIINDNPTIRSSIYKMLDDLSQSHLTTWRITFTNTTLDPETYGIIVSDYPEKHLSSNGQAEWMDEVIALSKDRQFVIESNSEIIFRRLMRRVGEGVIAVKDIKIYFVDYRKKPYRVSPVVIDKYGEISHCDHPWDFFGNNIITGDMCAHGKVVLKRRGKKQQKTLRNSNEMDRTGAFEVSGN